MNPNNLKFLSNLAACLILNEQEPEKAVQYTLRVLNVHPRSAVARLNHALALLLNERVEDARRTLEPIEPRSLSQRDQTSYYLAQFKIAARVGDAETALEHYDLMDVDALYPSQADRVEKTRRALSQAVER